MSSRSELKSIIAAAQAEAVAAGSARFEVEHLLLGLAATQQTAAGRLLAAEGLDHSTLQAALDRDTGRTLAAVGISVSDFALPAETLPHLDRPGFGQSTKLAFHRGIRLQRAAKARSGGRKRGFNSLHLLLGILHGESTVTRALDRDGIDTAAIAARARALLDSGE